LTDSFDIVIAGSGIAGLTAALTAARLGRKTLVLAGDTLGGQLLSIARVDGFPGFPEGIPGYDLCPIAQEQAIAAGAEFAGTNLASLEPEGKEWRVVTESSETYRARSVILATGSNLKPLGIPGEARLGGKGVSHCASCDAPLLRGKIAAVVGGGDSAAQEALVLAESVGHVVLLHRGAALRAQGAYRDPVMQHPKIELRFNTVAEEVLGDTNVKGLRVRDLGSGAAADLEISGFFAYAGLEPNSSVLGGRLALDPTGAIPTDGAMRTALAGLAAAGAVRSGWLGRAAISAGDGSTAAMAIDRYLETGDWRA
jgi:thioredoxin reductase (NADPH)